MPTEVAESEHDSSVEQQAPEKASAQVWFHRFEDAEELNHLQWQCQGSVNVAVLNWSLLDGHPVLVQVEAMHRGDERDYHASHTNCETHPWVDIVVYRGSRRRT